MSQESTMICIDNSDWMRNGDLPPTRFYCQQEAVRTLVHYKLRINPENAVGLISLANRIEVLNSLLTDDRKLMVRLHSLEINGSTKIFSGIKTAYLALKHRKNRNHKMRIIVFVGSPLDQLLIEKESFLKFAKKLKKEKINADFVLFGEAMAENNQIISDFVNILNGSDGQGSHLLVVPAGDTKLFDAILRSPICDGAGAVNLGAGAKFGINDEDDPELAMALRISLEEQRVRQQEEQSIEGNNEMEVEGGEGEEDSSPDKKKSSKNTVEVVDKSQIVPPINFEEMTEEEQMAYALQMSVDQVSESQQPSRSRSPSTMATPAPTPMETEEVGDNGQTGGGVVGDLLNDPARLQQLVDQRGKQSREVKVTQYPSSNKKNKDKNAGTSEEDKEKGKEDK
ncbi:VWFA domain-containing protein [Meloidogyne graminicola]|uniref:26S proteasome non-ATPase regulatory subunit 4 n=1 Tax=Meloidogyne graminicola TaxID=189291 RepID=A0A8S9ZSZ9_9BILA|nr:VWFA domain-containing protein [Meloidogyne graminicola]